MVNETAQPEAEKQVENDTQKNDEKETQQTEQSQTDEATEGGDVDKKEEIDYKAELERLQSQHAKDQDIIDKKNRAIEAEKRKRKESDVEFDEEDLQRKIQEAVDNQIDGFKKSFVSDAIQEEIASVASSKSEAELIDYHLKNTLRLSGASRYEIRQAVKSAKLLANEKRILNDNRELSEALKAKATTKSYAEGAGERIAAKDKGSMTKEEESFLSHYKGAADNIQRTAPASRA